MAKYNIGITTKLTGLSEYTLRAWENRHQIVLPSRNSSGHREYNQEEVNLLKILNQLCQQGHNISTLKDKSLTELTALLSQLGIENFIKNAPVLNGRKLIIDQALSNLLLGLESFRLDIVSHEFYNLKMRLTHRDLALKVIAPLMIEVGKKITEKKLSIAQEHAISSIIKFHLGQFMYSGQQERQRKGKLFILTTPDGDYHEFGILLASLLCAHYNQHFFYLGPNMPVQSLLQAANALDANEIILGSTFVSTPNKKSLLDKYLETLLRELPHERKLILGGTGNFDLKKVRLKINFDYMPSLEQLDKYLESKT